MFGFNKQHKVSYAYPLGYPIKVVVKRLGRQWFLGWLFQKYATKIQPGALLISERIVELPLLHQWFGKIFLQSPADVSASRGEVLEIGHMASSISLELASLGYTATGIDLRSYPFSHPNLMSVTGDFLTHTFSKQFDCIFTLSTIEHFGFTKRYDGLEDDVDNHMDEDAFAKIAHLLKPSGHAIISVPYTRTLIPSTWFRIYTRETLNTKLSKYFTIIEQRFFRRDNNQWTQAVDHAHDPVSPRDGVAIFLLTKKT